jgi:hypothetical protein
LAAAATTKTEVVDNSDDDDDDEVHRLPLEHDFNEFFNPYGILPANAKHEVMTISLTGSEPFLHSVPNFVFSPETKYTPGQSDAKTKSKNRVPPR